MKDVAIYTTTVCKYCAHAKEFFKEHDIKYAEYNVGTDPQKREEMVNLSGQLGVPVITIDNNVVIGYNEEVLKKLLLTA
jgi:glutaredoxin 3